jgi:hypothetical protein
MGGLWCIVLSALAFLGLNSNRIGSYLLSLDRPTALALIAGASVAAVAFLLIVNMTRDSVSSFIYFNF